jgi:hypothetical protein
MFYLFTSSFFFLLLNLSIDQRVVPFFFLFLPFFPLLLLLCIILRNFKIVLCVFFVFFSLDRLIDRRLYKTGRCLANSRYLLCLFFSPIKEIRSYIFNIYININYYLEYRLEHCFYCKVLSYKLCTLYICVLFFFFLCVCIYI